jgi:hypothetical protein
VSDSENENILAQVLLPQITKMIGAGITKSSISIPVVVCRPGELQELESVQLILLRGELINKVHRFLDEFVERRQAPEERN